MTPDELIASATDFYLNTRNFNGYPGHYIRSMHDQGYDNIRELFNSLVSDGRGVVVFGDRHPNPHIRAFADESQEAQLKKLESTPLEHACLYPSAQYLSTVVKNTDYCDRPFTRELALGAGQLNFCSFDLSVLESYRNDPRYYYSNDDIRGQICVSDEFYESDQMQEKDQIILETFGFSYDEKMNRAVATFYIYLSRLSPEHQQIWSSKLVAGDFHLHPDYYRNCIMGDWGSGISIFNAFLEELKVINLMCAAMNRPNLFRDSFEDNRPKKFSFLVRPTQGELNEFVLTLDKMMSDNINKKFFKSEVPDETEEMRDDGKIIVRQRGTIAMLDDWFSTNIMPDEPEPMKDMILAFKKVRKLRQKPAHSLKPDVFDQKYFKEQRNLVVAAYTAIRTIRLLFTSHQSVQEADIKISNVLYEEKVWTQ